MKKHNISSLSLSVKILLVLLLSLYTIGVVIYLYTGPYLSYKITKKYKAEKPRIVVSLTTTPYRINKIKPTLDSLLSQSIPADKIYLNVPDIFMRENIEYKIPSWLAKMDGIEIIRGKDFGPATKLLPALKQETDPESIIITVDDDVLYAKHMIRDLFNKTSQYPDKIITALGVSLDINDSNEIADSKLSYVNNGPSILAVGSNTVAYRKKFFNNNIFSLYERLPLYCVLSDDLIFSMYAARHDTDILQILDGIYNPLVRFHSGTLYHREANYFWDADSLSAGANGIGNNPTNYKKCLKHMAVHEKLYMDKFKDKSEMISPTKNIYSYFLTSEAYIQ